MCVHCTTDKAREITIYCTSVKSARYTFALILCNCNVTDAEALWIRHRDRLCKDIYDKVTLRLGGDRQLEYNSDIYDEGLLHIEKLVRSMTGCDVGTFGLIGVSRSRLDDDDGLGPNVQRQLYSYEERKELQKDGTTALDL